jgi:hypothetical protein
MPSAAIQDAHNLKIQIARVSTPLPERCRLAEQLIELYPSRRNRQFVNAFIRRYPFGNKYGCMFDLRMKINAEKIAAHRALIMANRKAKEIAKRTGSPVGATMKVMGSDGKMHWSDGLNDLGVVDEQINLHETSS